MRRAMRLARIWKIAWALRVTKGHFRASVRNICGEADTIYEFQKAHMQ